MSLAGLAIAFSLASAIAWGNQPDGHSSEEGRLGGGVYAIHIDDDRVWVGGDGELACRADGQWRRWSQADGMPQARIVAIDVNSETNEVWLGMLDGGLVRFSAGRFDAFDQYGSGVGGDQVYDVAWATGRIWAATNGGLSVFDPRREHWMLLAPRRANEAFQPVTRLAVAGDRVYAGQWRGDHWSIGRDIDESTSINNLASNVLGVDRSARDNVPIAWAVGHGVMAYATTQLVCVAALESPASPQCLEFPDRRRRWVYSMESRDAGELWLGTSDGLIVLLAGTKPVWLGGVWTSQNAASPGLSLAPLTPERRLVGASDGNDIPVVHALAFAESEVWVGTSDGLFRLGPVCRGQDLAASPTVLSAELISGKAHRADQRQAIEPQSHKRALAMYGPRNSTIALPGSTQPPSVNYRAYRDRVAECIREHNAQQGSRGRSAFELVTVPAGYERYLWGLPEDDLVYFDEQPAVGAIVGALNRDGNATERALSHLSTPMVSTTPLVELLGADAGVHPNLFECHTWKKAAHRAIMDRLMSTSRDGLLQVIDDAQGSYPEAHWWRDYAQARGWRPVRFGTLEGCETGIVGLDEREEIAGVLLSSGTESLGSRLRMLSKAGIKCPVVLQTTGGTFDLPERLPEVALELIVPVGMTEGAPNADGSSGETVAYPSLGPRAQQSRKGREEKDDNRRAVVRQREGQAWFDAADHAINAMSDAASRATIRARLQAMRDSPFGESHYERRYSKPLCLFAVYRAGAWTTESIPVAAR